MAQSCNAGRGDEAVPGCGSSILQRWGFALRELRQAFRRREGSRREQAEPPTGRMRAAEGIDGKRREP